MKKILVLHGPNLNLLGKREPDIYGTLTLDEINTAIQKEAEADNIEIKIYQSNHEGVIIDMLHDARNWANGVIINPGALAHYSYALRDAITSCNIPAIEVHITNTCKREPFRQASVTAPACIGHIQGLGLEGYLMALRFLAVHN